MGQPLIAEGSVREFRVIRVIFYQQNVNFIYFARGFHGLSPRDTGPESCRPEMLPALPKNGAGSCHRPLGIRFRHPETP
jgi:hypothetical protein